MSKPGRYSKVYRRMWVDEKVKKLSQPPPCGVTLWLRLLTGPELTNIPGLFPAWEGGLASALHWSLEAFRDAFAELNRQGMVEADWDAGLVWVPNAIEHNEPESIHVVEAWEATIRELPDCPLKHKAFAVLEAWAKAKGMAWAKAWEKACPKGDRGPSPIQEQDTRSDRVGGSKDLTGSATPEPKATPSPAPTPQRLPTRGERAAEDLMICPASELAARCKANPHDAGMTALEERQDVAAVNAAWSKAVGLTPRRLGRYTDRNAPLLAILEALEVTPLDDLLRACDQASRDDWCRGLRGSDRDPARKRDIGCLSRKVLNHLLVAADAHAEKQRKRKENEARIAASEAAQRNRDRIPRPRMPPIDTTKLFATMPEAPAQAARPRAMTPEEIDEAIKQEGGQTA